MTQKKKLIEVALPLKAINQEGSLRKRKAPAGYPTTFHKWWAQRPLAAARAVIFAQIVDDPSAYPDIFTTEKAQEKERQRLFRIIEKLVTWDNTTNEKVLEQATAEIWQSWRRACAENADHPRASELFDRHKLPTFHDPFAGGGSLPLEAQRLGLETHASDLNPVAVLINKAMTEVPTKFSSQPPVNPESRKGGRHLTRGWKGAQGIAEDVRYYGKWMRDEAEKRIGHFYPKIDITTEMASDRPDLKPFVGRRLTVVAWLWARTVKSPNPAFTKVDVPLITTFMLSTKKGKECYIEPKVDGDRYCFEVRTGKPQDPVAAKQGTKISRGANFRCLVSGAPIDGDYIKSEGVAGRLGSRLIAIVAQGKRGRIYISPTPEHESVAREEPPPEWRPDVIISGSTQYLGVKPYGMEMLSQIFTDRQLLALNTFSSLVQDVQARVNQDSLINKQENSDSLCYADVIAIYLAISISRLADYGSTIATWRPKDNAMRSGLPKQAIQMSWDYAEGSPFAGSSAGFLKCVGVVSRVLTMSLCTGSGIAVMGDAASRRNDMDLDSTIVSTDPPYYDNVPYADLSDFFYVWLRRSLKSVYPDLFATIAVPKAAELVAFSYRHGSKAEAEDFFLDGMTQAMTSLAERAHPVFPVTIYYAFRQAESKSETGTVSTGWEVFLDAVIRAGFCISGTWPLRTEGDNRQRSVGTNALASSIVLVCRPRPIDVPTTTRRAFLNKLNAELPKALVHLQHSNIAPVDLAQAAIGPGMAIYTRYSQVLDATGQPLSVREALSLINQTLDEVLTEQEGDFDADSRWALAWFDQSGFDEGEFGVAETLSKAKNTSVSGMVDTGILTAKGGKVRLLRPDELPEKWAPSTESRLTVWETVHHLIRVLESGGESAAAELVKKLGSQAEVARELAYRLYTLCERKKRAQEALSYNSLVQSWPEILRLSREVAPPSDDGQMAMFGQD